MFNYPLKCVCTCKSFSQTNSNNSLLSGASMYLFWLTLNYIHLTIHSFTSSCGPIKFLPDSLTAAFTVASWGQIMASCLRWRYYLCWGCFCSWEMCSLEVQYLNCSPWRGDNRLSYLDTGRCHSLSNCSTNSKIQFYHVAAHLLCEKLYGDIWGILCEFSSYQQEATV